MPMSIKWAMPRSPVPKRLVPKHLPELGGVFDYGHVVYGRADSTDQRNTF